MQQLLHDRKLERVWRDCERLWKWVSIQRNKRSEAGRSSCVDDLKKRWFRCHPFKKRAGGINHCFFCAYAKKAFIANIGNRPRRLEAWTHCDYCPGRLVDPNFNCANAAYSYQRLPSLFYKEITRLNILRKQQKGTQL